MKTLQLETSLPLSDSAFVKISLNPCYVTGFCEGESTFTYVRNGKGINLRFAVKLNESDKDLIYSIMAFFGVGNIYRVGARKPTAASGSTAIAWYYCVSKIDDLGVIVRHFDAYPMAGHKASNYRVWKQMYELKQVPRRFDAVALNHLALTLSGMSTKGRRNLKPRALTRPHG